MSFAAEDEYNQSYIVCGCGDKFESQGSFSDHLLSSHDVYFPEKVVFKCSTCSKSFDNEKAFAEHTHKVQEKGRKHEKHKYPPVVCEICGKKYASNAALGYHMRVHTGERPFHCSMCPKAFTMRMFLEIHERSHTGERPYQCDICPKAFTNQAALRRHGLVHSGIKPYKCPRCGKSFQQTNSVKLHISTVHDKNPAPYRSKYKRKTDSRILSMEQSDNVNLDENEEFLFETSAEHEDMKTEVFVEVE